MSKNLNITRRRLIDSVCNLAPIYLLQVFIEFERGSLQWWKYLLGLVVYIAIVGVYKAFFKRFVYSIAANTTAISTAKKYLCYLAVVAINLVDILILDYLPLTFIASVVISVVANFALTMTLCRYISKG